MVSPLKSQAFPLRRFCFYLLRPRVGLYNQRQKVIVDETIDNLAKKGPAKELAEHQGLREDTIAHVH